MTVHRALVMIITCYSTLEIEHAITANGERIIKSVPCLPKLLQK